MKKTDIISSASKSLSKIGFKLKKHSPEILIVAGIVGTVASAIMACKATTKISSILDKTKEDVEKIHECLADESLAEEYTQEDGKKDLTVVYIQTGVKLIRLYTPAIALGVLSLSGIIASNNILRKRNVALAAAYATIDKGFKEYRNRVVERFGEVVDRELKYNIKAKQVEETIVDDKGKEKTVTKNINIANPDINSDYARYFDDKSMFWEQTPEYNLMFLKSRQAYANDKLKANGRLFLNEVYDMLGFEPSKAGQVVGWVYDPNNPLGDNYVDFGIYDIHREVNRDFVNGYESAILLDFNVDGNIWELM